MESPYVTKRKERKPTTTIRIRVETKSKLEKIAADEDISMVKLLDKIIEKWNT